MGMHMHCKGEIRTLTTVYTIIVHERINITRMRKLYNE